MSRLLLAAAVGLLFFPDASLALPQMTPGCSLSIKTPDPASPAGELDAGVLLGADCKTIYIMPPRVGSVDLSAVAPSANVSQCPAVFNANRSVNLAEEAKLTAVKNFNDALTAKDAAAVLQWEAIARNADALATQLAQSLDKYALIEGATSAVLMKIQYNELVKAYEAVNDKSLSFQRMPIKAGFMTYKSVVMDPLNQIAIQRSRSAALEVLVAGIQDKSLGDFNITTPDGQSTISFSDSAGGSIRLSLAGACPFYDDTKKKFEPRDFTSSQVDVRGHLAATYSYFYPVQTKGSYRVTFNAEVLGDMIKKLVETRNGDVSASVLAEDLMDIEATEAFKIEINQDLNNSLPNEAAIGDRFKAAIATSFVHDLLSKLSSVTKQEDIPDINVNFTGFRDQAQRARHCKRGGFLGLGRSCSDYVYTIKVPAEQVKTRVREVSVDLSARYSSEAVQISTVVFPGTTGFAVRVGK